jgi:hypothetical protein
MAISESTVDTSCLPLRKEKRISVVACLLLALFGFGFIFARLRPRSTSHSFQLNAVDDRAYDARQAPQVRNHVPLNFRAQKTAHYHNLIRTINLQRSFLQRSFHSLSCLSYNSTHLMQIVTGSAMDDASGVDYVLSNVTPPIDVSFSSSLSTKSVVNIANGFQTQLLCKSLIS